MFARHEFKYHSLTLWLTEQTERKPHPRGFIKLFDTEQFTNSKCLNESVEQNNHNTILTLLTNPSLYWRGFTGKYQFLNLKSEDEDPFYRNIIISSQHFIRYNFHFIFFFRIKLSNYNYLSLLEKKAEKKRELKTRGKGGGKRKSE